MGKQTRWRRKRQIARMHNRDVLLGLVGGGLDLGLTRVDPRRWQAGSISGRQIQGRVKPG